MCVVINSQGQGHLFKQKAHFKGFYVYGLCKIAIAMFSIYLLNDNAVFIWHVSIKKKKTEGWNEMDTIN